MSIKKRTNISVLLFILIFGGLLLTATFTDLTVSNILTKTALSSHEYYTNSFFGATFECVGSAPVYLMIAFAVQILFLNVYRFKNDGFVKALLLILGGVASVAAYYAWFSETIGYFLQHTAAESFEGSSFLTGLAVFISVIMAFFGMLAVNNFSDDSLKKLLNASFAILAAVIVANVLVAVVKVPVGRMRYRAMNTAGGASIGGFDNFTRWYVFNGQMDKEEMLRLFGTTDACKSFPSGHTCAAGMSYGLIMLTDALNIKSKWKKAALWIIPIVFTATVAISRIIVGAHFFSDVLMGGTISFVCMIIAREIFICKGSHVKAVFNK